MTMHRRYILLLMVVVVVIGGCVTLPTGPSVMVLPAHGKSFEQFQSDDALCRQWAQTADRNEPSGNGQSECRYRGRCWHGSGRRTWCCHRRRLRESGRWRGNRCRQRACCWGVVRCKCRPGLWLGSAAPIRHFLSAVYVCQGECDPGESSHPANNAATAPSPGL